MEPQATGRSDRGHPARIAGPLFTARGSGPRSGIQIVITMCTVIVSCPAGRRSRWGTHNKEMGAPGCHPVLPLIGLLTTASVSLNDESANARVELVETILDEARKIGAQTAFYPPALNVSAVVLAAGSSRGPGTTISDGAMLPQSPAIS
jgi:hypothetical protein